MIFIIFSLVTVKSIFWDIEEPITDTKFLKLFCDNPLLTHYGENSSIYVTNFRQGIYEIPKDDKEDILLVAK